MREIKFRGKRYGDGAWVYGSLYQGTKEGEEYNVILNDSGYHLAPPDDRNLAIAFAENEVDVVMPDTIGQFTGLYDENGEQIYEGDIVERFQPMPHYRNGVYYDGNAIYGVVRYIDAGFYILSDKQAYELSRNFDMWLQGNIYDNAELLNE